MQCLECQYELRGLEGRVCPECGREFDPGDARTFTSAGLQERMQRRTVRLGLLGASMPLCMVGLMYLVGFVRMLGCMGEVFAVPLEVIWVVLGLMVPVGVVLAIVCVIHTTKRLGDRGLVLGVVCAGGWVLGVWWLIVLMR